MTTEISFFLLLKLSSFSTSPFKMATFHSNKTETYRGLQVLIFYSYIYAMHNMSELVARL